MKHVEIHKQYLKRKVSNEATAKAPKETRKRMLQKLLLKATEEQTKIWDINDLRAQRITRKVGEMIASIGMKEEVSKLLTSDEPVVSLTIDIWSCSSNDTSLLSLTTHWIDKSFAKASAVLHAQALEMAYTGEYMAERISSMLGSWNIPGHRNVFS